MSLELGGKVSEVCMAWDLLKPVATSANCLL